MRGWADLQWRPPPWPDTLRRPPPPPDPAVRRVTGELRRRQPMDVLGGPMDGLGELVHGFLFFWVY
jgi:hypothetical protein